jgi:hypothetical protein
LYSLEKYISSKDFAPSEELTMDVIDKVFEN